MRPLELVLEHLDGVRPVGEGYVARCPRTGHGKGRGDVTPSLSVKEGEDGRVLLNCHAGCPTGEVLVAMGLSMSDLFKQGEVNDSNGPRKIIEVYDYTDEAGNLLFQSVRYEPKGFSQRRPDGGGGWKYQGIFKNGTRPVPYRLPKVAEAVLEGRTIFVVEGEKDVHRLEREGLVGTTNPMGAGKWRDAFSDALVDADVRIIPDNDDAGREHARKVAESLRGKARNVHVIELPGLPPGGDVSDWFDGGGTAEQLRSLPSSPKVPPFPVEALPDTVREYVKGAAEAIGCAVDLIAAPVLAVLSAGIGASRVVEIKRGWREGVALFIAVVAEPGDKKTPAANEAKRPVMRRQVEKRSEYKAKKAEYELELREWKAECQRARKESEAEPPPPAEPTMERVYADDTTVEALVGILEDNPRGILLYKDELTGWIRGLDQYKGGRGNDRQFWLSIHNNSPVVVDRKGRQGDPVHLDHPFVTLAGGIQPAMLPELGGAREDGLLDRFLFAYPHHSSTDLSDVEMDPEIEGGFARLYGLLCSLRTVEDVATGLHRPNVTPMSPDARRRFKEIHDAIGRESRQAGFPARLRGVWAKMRGYLARISLILALCRCAESGEVEPVEVEDVENAAVIVAYFQSHARRVYGKLGSVTREDLLAGELRALLEDHGRAWRGTATELYAKLDGRSASGLPENAEWLSKKVRTIGESGGWLTVESGHRGKGRILKLGLANTDGAVGTVSVSSTSTNSTDGTGGKYEYRER